MRLGNACFLGSWKRRSIEGWKLLRCAIGEVVYKRGRDFCRVALEFWAQDGKRIRFRST